MIAIIDALECDKDTRASMPFPIGSESVKSHRPDVVVGHALRRLAPSIAPSRLASISHPDQDRRGHAQPYPNYQSSHWLSVDVADHEAGKATKRDGGAAGGGRTGTRHGAEPCHVPARDGSPARNDTAGAVSGRTFTIVGRSSTPIARKGTTLVSGPPMFLLPYLADPRSVVDADHLIDAHGTGAAAEAAARADRSRSLGNHVHFCHWRQVERLIDLLAAPEPVGTVH